VSCYSFTAVVARAGMWSAHMIELKMEVGGAPIKTPFKKKDKRIY
jgi:hypothetical protein